LMIDVFMDFSVFLLCEGESALEEIDFGR
jgi:hypothetical protein